MSRSFLSTLMAAGFCVVAFSGLSQAQTLECSQPPGIGLCRQIQDVSYSLNFTCTGDACYDVWRRQINSLRQFSYTYEQQVPYGTPASEEIGNLAATAASRICRSTATGDCNWMEALFNAKTDALPKLVEIQENAGFAEVINCQLNYSCN